MKTKSMVRRFIPKRAPWSHKGDFGKLLIIGGSRTYTGAPALAGMAAYRTGCDIVEIFSPKRAADIIASFSPNFITHPANGDFLNPWHTKAALEDSETSDSVVIGNGMGRRPETFRFVQDFLTRTDKPCVIDADAIRAAAGRKGVLKQHFVLTPHGNEMLSLTNESPSQDMAKRIRLVKNTSKNLGAVILLKGHYDVISNGEKVHVNRTGCPEMAKSGTGDVLAGICGALLAMGIKPFEAAYKAARISGLAGEIAAKKYRSGLMPTDVIEEIPRIL